MTANQTKKNGIMPCDFAYSNYFYFYRKHSERGPLKVFQASMSVGLNMIGSPCFDTFFVRDGIKFRADYKSARVVSCVVSRLSYVVRFFFYNGIFSKRIELEG